MFCVYAYSSVRIKHRSELYGWVIYTHTAHYAYCSYMSCMRWICMLPTHTAALNISGFDVDCTLLSLVGKVSLIFLKWGIWQTVQNQIRRHKTRRLIRSQLFAYRMFYLNLNKNGKKTIPPNNPLTEMDWSN